MKTQQSGMAMRSPRGVFFLLVFCLLPVCFLMTPDMSGAQARTPRPRTATAPLVLTDLDGVTARPLEMRGVRARVFVFIAHDCPIANRYAPEIVRLTSDYAEKKIDFQLVYVERDLTAAQARNHAQAHGFTCRALRDPRHLLARRLRATVTPEAVVIGANGRTQYQGRIDNRVQGIGRMHSQSTKAELRDALDAILAGKPVAVSRTQPYGCFISDAS